MSDGVLAVILASLGVVLLLLLVWYVLQVIAYWKIFEKFGEPGWKSIIPFYSEYIQYKFTWNANFYWVYLFGSALGIGLQNLDGVAGVFGSVIVLAMAVLNIYSLHKLSKAFGHGAGFTVGLFFLNPIFKLILGFGKDEYLGPQ